MSARVPAAAVVVLAAGCGEDPQLAKADEVARTYLRVAATGDAERVCARCGRAEPCARAASAALCKLRSRLLQKMFAEQWVVGTLP
jgi:hypothetical protein